MKNIKSKYVILFIFIEIFLVMGITFIVKTLNYEDYTENKFIEKTTLVLREVSSGKNVDEIIEEGGTRFNKLLTSLDIAQNSFAFAINTELKIKMYNKTKEEFSKALDLSVYPQLREVNTLAYYVARRNSGNFEFYSDSSKEKLLYFIQPVPNSKWSLVVSVLKDSIVMKTITERRYFFCGIACCILGLTMTASFFGWTLPKEIKNKFWYSTSLFAIGLAIGISILCVFSNRYHSYENIEEIPLTDQNIIDGFLDKYESQLKEDNSQVNRVKVGIFLKNIDFKSSTKVNYSGYLWEKLAKDQIGKVKEGFYFSDSFKSKFFKLHEKENSDGSKVFVWYFTCCLSADLSENVLYPFDVESVCLRLRSADFGNNVILLPDIRDYVDIEPYSKPGIYKGLIIPSWNITESYFTYLKEDYDSTFGVYNSHTGSVSNTELYFKVILRRSFLGAFISIFLPIFVTLVMMFILLLTCSNDEERSKKLGFSAGAILASTAALFFVVIVAQIDLRDKVAADGLLYMDIYYFVTYLQFLIVSINSILLCWPDKFKWIAWEDNIIIKSAFWPLVTLIIFISTLIYYFPQ